VSRATSDQIARRYDRLAGAFGPISVAFMLRPRLRDVAVRGLELERGAAVLEVGCGTGANLERLVAAVGPGGRVTGIDISAGMLERAERLRSARRWENVTLLVADAETLDGEGYDAILFSLSYSVLPRPVRTLEAAWGALCPGGTVVIMDAGLPASRLGRVLRPLATAASRATVLGDPDSRPWEDLARLGAEVETTKFQAGTYFVCRGTKPAPS
jgi:demethylmenaquinone methyltransferase/2-methoxy-6-polyprenyl-1,4-benzoquinol methylase